MGQRTDFGAMACSIARAWAVVGEPWTLLILRDISFGVGRFDELQRDLGIARSVLADRLRTLEGAGVVERRDYRSTNRRRAEYALTNMGEDLVPILVVLTRWGDRWLDDGAGPPIMFEHDCGAGALASVRCDSCGEPLTAATIRAHAGPGSRSGFGTASAEVLLRGAG